MTLFYRLPDASVAVPFAAVERNMRRWRAKNIPKIPSTLEDFAEVINQQEYSHLRQYANGRLTISTIRAADGALVTVFADEEQLAELSQIDELSFDGTFDVRPKHPKTAQLLTIMGLIDDTVCRNGFWWVTKTLKNREHRSKTTV